MAIAQQALLWVTAGPASDVEPLEAAARELGVTVQTCRPDAVPNAVRQTRFTIVGIELSADARAGLTLLRDVVERLPDAVAFVASADASVATMRAALEAGAADFLALPFNPVDLSRVLIRSAQEAASRAASRTLSGQIVTLYGCRGGLGCTTLAVNLAVQLKAATPGEVALMDLDLQRGDVAAFLNVNPAQSIAALAGAREVDEIFLHTAMTRHASGIFVLAAPDGLEAAESIGHAEATMACRLLRSQYHYTVVDTPRTITAATVGVLEQSDHVFVLTDLSLPGVRAAVRMLETLERLEIPAHVVRVLFTQAASGPIDPAEAARTIGRQPLLIIPNDRAAASQAMNDGTPLDGRPGALADAIALLASRIAGSAPPSARRRGGFIRRMFAKEARV